jgi:site-specific recombinase XerD
MDAKPKLLLQVRHKLRARHYSCRTEQQYIAWIRRLILHYDKRHPYEISGAEVEAFLTHLAMERRVSASTQNQALAAILFLYRQVLELELPWLENVVRARSPTRLPTVLSRTEVATLLSHTEGVFRLVAQLLHGSGLRLRTTQRYTHVMKKGASGVRSPLD